MTEIKREAICTRDLKVSTFSSATPNNIHELVWEDKSVTLRELIINYRLPLTVKLKAGDIRKCFPDVTCGKCTCKDLNPTPSSKAAHSCSSNGATNEMKFAANPNSTSASSSKVFECNDTVRGKHKQSDLVLQIHEIRRKKVILARKMTWDKRQNDYVVTGGQMEIPASVKGWLEVLPENGRPVEYYDTIDGITNLNPKRFLVRTTTVGYQLTTGDSGNCCWMPWEIKSGEILTTGIVYVDSKKNKAVHKNFLKKLWKQDNAKKEQDVKYLQCFDSAGSEIMIPLFMSGVFSPVGDSSLANYDAVYEFQDLVVAFGLPVNVQLVHVNVKESIQCPRGVIRLYGTREEEMVIVSKVGLDGDLFRNNLNNETCEIPIDNELLFSRGIMRKKTSKHPRAVNGHVSLDEHRKPVNEQSEEMTMKAKDNIVNTLVKEFSETSDPQGSMSLNQKAKHIVIDSPLCKQTADVNHNNVSLPTRTVTKQTPRFDNTTHEIHTLPAHPGTAQSQEQSASRGVELPEKTAKEQKSRPSYILEKLSVRKVKKVRAKLKELRSEDVFSKRLSRHELSYQDFYDDLENERKIRRNSDCRISMQDGCRPDRRDVTYKSSSSNAGRDRHPTSNFCTSPKTSSMYVSNTSSLMQRRTSMQKRELPPVPLDSSENSDFASPDHSTSLSKESVYEHLPQAPQLPHFRRASDSDILNSEYSCNTGHNGQDNEDDYLLPIQVQQDLGYAKRSDVQPHHKPPGLVKPNVSMNSMTPREACNEPSGDSPWKSDNLDRMCSLDIDDLFNFTYSPAENQHRRHVGEAVRPAVVSSTQMSGAAQVPERTLNLADSQAYFEQRFLDNLNLETKSSHCVSRHKPRYSKHTIINPNATLRSHNLRNIFPNVNEVFPFHDSQSPRHMYDNVHNNHIHNCPYQQQMCSCGSRPRLLSNHSTDDKMAIPPFHHHFHNLRDNNYGIRYSETDPSFPPSNHACFAGGFKDSFNQEDDSAISACSRGDVGYLNDSEYNSNQFGEHNTQVNDDGWLPPDQIEALSVPEVSKSLRYIGMKDRVVLRFSNEQIDGSMLCTLDEKLLKEGFPELNALEVKKILDFILGWRPKKS